ncbi:MAG TPA: hypothetical protein VLJ15_08970 [Gammaproteobacteria bacterium]|nr:hypothetical protein [Gammaproteobacteria bacterium]
MPASNAGLSDNIHEMNLPELYEYIERNLNALSHHEASRLKLKDDLEDTTDIDIFIKNINDHLEQAISVLQQKKEIEDNINAALQQQEISDLEDAYLRIAFPSKASNVMPTLELIDSLDPSVGKSTRKKFDSLSAAAKNALESEQRSLDTIKQAVDELMIFSHVSLTQILGELLKKTSEKTLDELLGEAQSNQRLYDIAVSLLTETHDAISSDEEYAYLADCLNPTKWQPRLKKLASLNPDFELIAIFLKNSYVLLDSLNHALDENDSSKVLDAIFKLDELVNDILPAVMTKLEQQKAEKIFFENKSEENCRQAIRQLKTLAQTNPLESQINGHLAQKYASAGFHGSKNLSLVAEKILQEGENRLKITINSLPTESLESQIEYHKIQLHLTEKQLEINPFNIIEQIRETVISKHLRLYQDELIKRKGKDIDPTELLSDRLVDYSKFKLGDYDKTYSSKASDARNYNPLSQGCYNAESNLSSLEAYYFGYAHLQLCAKIFVIPEEDVVDDALLSEHMREISQFTQTKLRELSLTELTTLIRNKEGLLKDIDRPRFQTFSSFLDGEWKKTVYHTFLGYYKEELARRKEAEEKLAAAALAEAAALKKAEMLEEEKTTLMLSAIQQPAVDSFIPGNELNALNYRKQLTKQKSAVKDQKTVSMPLKLSPAETKKSEVEIYAGSLSNFSDYYNALLDKQKTTKELAQMTTEQLKFKLAYCKIQARASAEKQKTNPDQAEKAQEETFTAHSKLCQQEMKKRKGNETETGIPEESKTITVDDYFPNYSDTLESARNYRSAAQCNLFLTHTPYHIRTSNPLSGNLSIDYDYELAAGRLSYQYLSSDEKNINLYKLDNGRVFCHFKDSPALLEITGVNFPASAQFLSTKECPIKCDNQEITRAVFNKIRTTESIWSYSSQDDLETLERCYFNYFQIEFCTEIFALPEEKVGGISISENIERITNLIKTKLSETHFVGLKNLISTAERVIRETNENGSSNSKELLYNRFRKNLFSTRLNYYQEEIARREKETEELARRMEEEKLAAAHVSAQAEISRNNATPASSASQPDDINDVPELNDDMPELSGDGDNSEQEEEQKEQSRRTVTASTTGAVNHLLNRSDSTREQKAVLSDEEMKARTRQLVDLVTEFTDRADRFIKHTLPEENILRWHANARLLEIKVNTLGKINTVITKDGLEAGRILWAPFKTFIDSINEKQSTVIWSASKIILSTTSTAPKQKNAGFFSWILGGGAAAPTPVKRTATYHLEGKRKGR